MDGSENRGTAVRQAILGGRKVGGARGFIGPGVVGRGDHTRHAMIVHDLSDAVVNATAHPPPFDLHSRDRMFRPRRPWLPACSVRATCSSQVWEEGFPRL